MTPFMQAQFVPNDDIGEVTWLAVDDAVARLSYAHDADVVRSAFPSR
jgi:hypothetical protein